MDELHEQLLKELSENGWKPAIYRTDAEAETVTIVFAKNHGGGVTVEEEKKRPEGIRLV